MPAKQRFDLLGFKGVAPRKLGWSSDMLFALLALLASHGQSRGAKVETCRMLTALMLNNSSANPADISLQNMMFCQFVSVNPLFQLS